MTSVVEMIGAGPGDPDLLTVRAEAALGAATVVVVDAAVAHLAAACAPGAIVSVVHPRNLAPDGGAADGAAAVDGDAIRILTGAARRGERVVRLYRGDPWLHPAYAVESAILAGAGVHHVAVPGPSVELGIGAGAGVPAHQPGLAVTLTPGAAPMPAPVHMVGAGPGDPLLVTRRAARLLADADVVVTDQRSTDAVVALAGPAAQHRYVGRTPEGPSWSFARVVDLVADEAEAGRAVVRLTNGDLFVCSSAAEEIAALQARGVTVTTTPGVSAATAAPLAAGMTIVPGAPVTVVSGADDPHAAPVDWAALADAGATLVVLGGRIRQRTIANRLLAAGAASATPAWVVHAAGRPGTRVATTDLAGLRTTRLQPPTVAVIGPVLRGRVHGVAPRESDEIPGGSTRSRR